MSPYLDGTSRFAYATFASMVGPNISPDSTKNIQGRVITLCHDDLPSKVAVGGFSNFARMYKENGFDSTGNTVKEDAVALRMIKNWRRNNPDIPDISLKGCLPFTTVVLELVRLNIFTPESTIMHARSAFNMKTVLINNGLFKENVAPAFIPSASTVSPADTQTQNTPSVSRAFECSSSGSALDGNDIESQMNTPVSNSVSSLKSASFKIKIDNSESQKEIAACFADSDQEESEDKQSAKRARRNIEEQFSSDSMSVHNENVNLFGRNESDGDIKLEEDIIVDWKGSFAAVSKKYETVQWELDEKTESLAEAEVTIARLKKEKEDQKKEMDEMEERMKLKIAKLEGELVTISEINSEMNTNEVLVVPQPGDIVVTKELFEQLMSKVSAIDNSLKELPSKDNLKNVVDHLDKSMEIKRQQISGEFKGMLKKSSDEILNKFEN